MADATRYELGDDVNTTLGQSALKLAQRIDSSAADTGSALATMVKQLHALMASRPAAVTGAEEDPVMRARESVAAIRASHMGA